MAFYFSWRKGKIQALIFTMRRGRAGPTSFAYTLETYRSAIENPLYAVAALTSSANVHLQILDFQWQVKTLGRTDAGKKKETKCLRKRGAQGVPRGAIALFLDGKKRHKSICR